MDNSHSMSSKVPFYNLEVNVLDRTSLFRELARRVSLRDHPVSINFLNAHCFNIAQKNVNYRAALGRCTYLLNDGVGIDIAGRLVGIHFKENLNGTDLIPELLQFFAEKGLSVFFFGAKPEVIQEARREIAKTYPDLSIAGHCDGYDRDPTSVIDQINSSRADALILGLGVPTQELWVDRYGSQLTRAKICVSGGAIFDFVSGNVKRAPRLIRRLRLEWLFRLIQEPRRLFSRYILGSVLFFYHVLVRYWSSWFPTTMC